MWSLLKIEIPRLKVKRQTYLVLTQVIANVFNVMFVDSRFSILVHVTNGHSGKFNQRLIFNIHFGYVIILEVIQRSSCGDIAEISGSSEETSKPYRLPQMSSFVSREMFQTVNIGVLRRPLSKVPIFARHCWIDFLFQTFGSQTRCGKCTLFVCYDSGKRLPSTKQINCVFWCCSFVGCCVMSCM